MDSRGQDVYVSVHAWSSFDGLSLECKEIAASDTSVVQTDPSTNILSSAVPRIELAAEADEVLEFIFPVPWISTIVSCYIFCPNGNADLILRFAGKPVVGDFSGTNDVSCCLLARDSLERNLKFHKMMLLLVLSTRGWVVRILRR